MRITLGNKEFELNEKRATELGVLTEIIQRKGGQVWHAGGCDILLLGHGESYCCIHHLEKGSKHNTSITEAWWWPAAILIGENLADYYAKKALANRG